MKNFVPIGVILMVLTIQYASGNSFLYVNFDNIQIREYSTLYTQPLQELKMEAEFDNNNEILFKLNYLNRQGKFVIDTSPPLMTDSLDVSKTTYLIHSSETQGVQNSYTFLISKSVFNSTDLNNPCSRIDQTDDYLCFFQIRNVQNNIYNIATIPITLRVHNLRNSTTKATLKLFGQMYKKSPHDTVIQSWVPIPDKENLQLTFDDPNRHDRLRVMRPKIMNVNFLNQTRPQYIYFQCLNGFNKLVIYTDDELNRQGNATVNLAKLGMPFDRDLHCWFKVLFIDLHSGTNLIPLKSSVQFAIRPDPYYTPAEIESVRIDNSTNFTNFTSAYYTLLEKYNRMERVLGDTQAELVKLEGFVGVVKRLGDIQNGYPVTVTRRLASKGLRSLMRKAASAAIRRA